MAASPCREVSWTVALKSVESQRKEGCRRAGLALVLRELAPEEVPRGRGDGQGMGEGENEKSEAQGEHAEAEEQLDVVPLQEGHWAVRCGPHP